MPTLRCDQTPSWKQLLAHAQQHSQMPALSALFEQDAQRFQRFSFAAPAVFADLSKQQITTPVLDSLLSLARECQLETKRDAMFRGDEINITEGRQVLHTALRGGANSPHYNEVQGVLTEMLEYAEQIHNQSQITDIVNIGIGGSDLGPRMAVQALEPFTQTDKRYHFVSNVDGFDLASVLQKLRPQNTLFIIVSKTFTTQETLSNAHSAKAWFEASGGTDLADHFIGVTTNIEAASAFGIQRTFGFWDWVGGRYSVWSAVGLVLAMAIGAKSFRAFLHGARQMDEHFMQTPLEHNVPVLLGLVDVWNRVFLQRSSRCVAPYHQGLARFAAYLQQLEMESNGKGVDILGNAVAYPTSATVWGEAGTNGQHAFFQMLHQGTDIIPVDFIIAKEAIYPAATLPEQVINQLKTQHQILLANALAQSRALMIGKTSEQALAEFAGKPSTGINALTLAKHRTFPGNRPSTTLLLQNLSPESLGALIALHEHRTFTCGAIWNLDSFDQWGVELGKTLAKDLLPRFKTGQTENLDASTAELLKRIR